MTMCMDVPLLAYGVGALVALGVAVRLWMDFRERREAMKRYRAIAKRHDEQFERISKAFRSHDW